MVRPTVLVACCLLLLGQIRACDGFDLTLDQHVPGFSASSQARPVCGVLRCTEVLADVDLSSDQGNRSRQLTSVSVYRARVSGDGTSGRWQLLASVTPQRPGLDRVSDAMKIAGRLSDGQASLSLELLKTHDCQESQFSCVAVSVDSQGRTSVKTSLVGKAVSSQTDFAPQLQAAKVSVPSGNVFSGDGQSSLVGTVAQLVSLFQTRLDSIESRLEDSMESLGNRLEDKVGESRASVNDRVGGLDSQVEARIGALDLRINGLENRLEDKLDRLEDKVAGALSKTRTTSSDNDGACGLLASKLDGVDAKMADNRDQLDTCVTEVVKLSKNKDIIKENLSEHLSTVSTSVQFVERNVTNVNDRLAKLETSTDQCALAAATEVAKLTDLTYSVASLSGLTQDLASRVSTFSKAYAGGALEPVEEFFDLLGTGKKEWRLAFRGTPYINVQFYPAYMHGTGIPVEVEEGCKQFNHSLPCVNHYRNRDAFDDWAGVDEVLFAVYKDDQMVHRVIFNGKGSSYTTWFSEGRVIDSSWVDLTTKSHNFFSITGDFSDNTHRRFYMSYDHDRACNGFRGWFMGGDTSKGCAVENTVSYPTFFYATGRTFTVWPSASTGRADALGVFLKYE